MQNVIITIERAPNGQDVLKITADHQGAGAFDPENPAHQMAAYLMQAAANMPGVESTAISGDLLGPNQTLILKAA